VEEPKWIEVSGDKASFINAAKSSLNFKAITFAVVVLDRREFKKDIKANLDIQGIPSQFILTNTIRRDKIAVFRSILKQMNAKLKSDLYRLSIPLKSTMVIGIDYCQ
jgi:aubergine